MTPETLALKTCGLSVATPEPVRYGMRLNLESATGPGVQSHWCSWLC